MSCSTVVSLGYWLATTCCSGVSSSPSPPAASSFQPVFPKPNHAASGSATLCVDIPVPSFWQVPKADKRAGGSAMVCTTQRKTKNEREKEKQKKKKRKAPDEPHPISSVSVAASFNDHTTYLAVTVVRDALVTPHWPGCFPLGAFDTKSIQVWSSQSKPGSLIHGLHSVPRPDAAIITVTFPSLGKVR
ncbi:hypothetical protein BDW74DRAFT_125666 [Aspergillus multicolor]|uniref:uncharacterized protein n=1 Tax=Aspergillus multicolor TaxID=41759 RepID=UPI003CCCD943